MDSVKKNKTADMKEYKKDYNKSYYLNNKDKFKKKRGQRGEGKKDKYELSILDNNGNVLYTEKFKTQKDISHKLGIKEYTINRIFLNKFQYDKKGNSMYNKYKILKL